MSLQSKLDKRVPGAVVRPNHGGGVVVVVGGGGGTVAEYLERSPLEAWVVTRAGRTLATGPTEREAVDRAIWLWEVRP